MCSIICDVSAFQDVKKENQWCIEATPYHQAHVEGVCIKLHNYGQLLYPLSYNDVYKVKYNNHKDTAYVYSYKK